MTLALALLLSVAAQADSVKSVSANQTGGATATVSAWTEAAPGAVSSVELLVSPHKGSPSPASDTVRLSQVRAERRVWTIPAVAFDRDARGATVPARAVLHGSGGGSTHVVELELIGGRTVCRAEALEPAAGLIQAELLLDEGGRSGSVRIVLSEQARDIRAVELILGASTQGASPTRRELRASLEQVEQLWSADLGLSSGGGASYQVDAVVLDAQGQPFGTSLTGDVVVQSGALTVRPPCERAPGAVAMR